MDAILEKVLQEKDKTSYNNADSAGSLLGETALKLGNKKTLLHLVLINIKINQTAPSAMAKRIIDINPYVRTQRDRIDRIVHSAIASAQIDGIKVHEGEVRRMTSRAVKQYSTRK